MEDVAVAVWNLRNDDALSILPDGQGFKEGKRFYLGEKES
jgi:hypothetical protein